MLARQYLSPDQEGEPDNAALRDIQENLPEIRGRFRAQPDYPIGVAIMSQRIMAGVGNVYKSEVLSLEGVSPFIRTSECSDDQLDQVVIRSADLMRRNLEGRRRRTRFALDRSKPLWAYSRRGLPCFRCGVVIEMERHGVDGRTT